MRNKITLLFLSIFAATMLAACGKIDGTNDRAVKDDVSVEETNVEIQLKEENEQNVSKETESDDQPSTNSSDSSHSANKEVEGELTVHFIDVGQADATLIEYEGEEEQYRILYDAGNWNRNDVVNYLHSHSIDYIDILIGSHIHADHIGQMDKVIEAVGVGEVWMTGEVGTSQTFERIIQAIETNEVDYHEPRAGEIYDIGPVVLEILHPTNLVDNPNNNSISMKLTFGDVSFVMTGDAEAEVEASMLQRGYHLNADILSLGHHGSSTSSSRGFIDAVKPEVAIYSAGAGNSYGHPHDEVVSLMNEKGIDLYGTDVHGTIIVKTDGNDYSVLTKKDGTISPPSTSTKKNNNEKKSNSSYEKKEKTPPASTGNCIDINTASVEELQQIIHIGPARAEEMSELRPFSSIDDLSRVKGIGPARLKDIKAENKACVR